MHSLDTVCHFSRKITSQLQNWAFLTYLYSKLKNTYIYPIQERQNVSNTSRHQEVVVSLLNLPCYSHFSSLQNFKCSSWKIMIFAVVTLFFWRSDMLTAEQCAAYVTTCKKNLAHIWKHGNMFLNHIVTGDESCCHCDIQISEHSSLTWKHKNSPCATKTRSRALTRKVMLMLFFDISGPILVKWMSKGKTMNAVWYVDTLKMLHANIKDHWKERLSTGVVLLHDNARTHMVGLTRLMLTTLEFEVPAHPAYSLNLSPCDYKILGSLKTFLEGKRFSPDKVV